MTSRLEARLFAFLVLGLGFTVGVSSCGDSAPACATVDDCGRGELCVEDEADPAAQICAQSCTSTEDGCGECRCADGDTGYCGEGLPYVMACREDGSPTLWTQTICACQARGDQQALEDCVQAVAEQRAAIPSKCSPLLDELIFCLYRHLENVAEGCELPEGRCQSQADAISSC